MKKPFTKFKRGLLAAAFALGLSGTANAQTIFSESFTGTGIPTGWTNFTFVGTTAFIRETDGVSNGAQYYGTFAGPTLSNGYVLYDSDANANPLDSVQLTTPAINTTGKASVFLKFNEYYREFSSAARVLVSTNGTTWTNVHTTDAGLATNAATLNPQLVNVDISSVAANQATVYVRFEYSSFANGGAYWWFLDDVEVYSPAVTGTNETIANNAVAIYPNPSNGTFKIQFSNELTSAKAVEIRNINGQLVYSANANASSEAMNVNLEKLAAGVYTLQVKSDAVVAVKRLVIE